jgi:REP element-mobilizing transposase RayT
MARPLRIEQAGAWYHVTGRGLERRHIFADAKDRSHWLELLAEASDLWRLVVHGYAQMENHYHLILETLEPNLARTMHWLNTSYAAWYNRRHQRAGPLFQGVYKAILVEPSSWGLALSRYVHLNPVRTVAMGLDKKARRAGALGLRGQPEGRLVEQRIEQLRSFKWSSYRAYIGLDTAPDWLECRRVWDLNGRGSRREQQRAYRAYVEEAVREGLEEKLWEQVKGQIVLGSQRLWRKIQKGMGDHQREQPQARQFAARPDLSEVIAAVEELKGQRWKEFRERHNDCGRDLVFYLARRLGSVKLKELGAAAGGLDYAAVSIAVKRFERGLKAEKPLAQLLKRATGRLAKC